MVERRYGMAKDLGSNPSGSTHEYTANYLSMWALLDADVARCILLQWGQGVKGCMSVLHTAG